MSEVHRPERVRGARVHQKRTGRSGAATKYEELGHPAMPDRVRCARVVQKIEAFSISRYGSSIMPATTETHVNKEIPLWPNVKFAGTIMTKVLKL